LLNLYLGLFLADCGLSVLDELGVALSGRHLLGWARNPVAMLTVLGALPAYGLVVLFRPVPRWVFAPLAVTPLAIMLLGLPLAYWLGWERYGMAQVTAAQTGLGLLAVWLLRRRTGRLWLVAEDLPGPLFTLGASLRMVAFTLLLLLPASTLAFVGLCERCLDRFTGGFVQVRWQGVELVERRYVQDDSEVRLVGMMHIGDHEAYEALVATFDQPEVLVLAEGVTDEQSLLGGQMHYEAVAEKAGLATQQRLESYRPGLRIRHADVDMSEMSESTQDTLRLTTRLFGDDGLDPQALMELMNMSAETSAEVQERFWRDVIDLRNEVLLGHLRAVVDEEAVVVVPWGAAHLPEIEQALFAMGYRLDQERSHPLLSWAGE
jgi:hypothetical protein